MQKVREPPKLLTRKNAPLLTFFLGNLQPKFYENEHWAENLASRVGRGRIVDHMKNSWDSTIVFQHLTFWRLQKVREPSKMSKRKTTSSLMFFQVSLSQNIVCFEMQFLNNRANPTPRTISTTTPRPSPSPLNIFRLPVTFKKVP